ncbi:MAG TPA: protein kinase [Planctomycetota bacterium]|nr:protein kinase [Planctomycetota bacterium]
MSADVTSPMMTPPPPPPPPPPGDPEATVSEATQSESAPMDPGPSSPSLNEDSDAIGGQPTRADLGTPNQAGRRFDDFQLEKKIGQGGMGEVYRARQISLDRPVAVKVLTRGLASQPGFVERFRREAKAAANIVHPHVIQIYAYGIANEMPYFAMEYVEGEDLQQRTRRLKRLPMEEIVDTMIAVASALAAAHEKNLIHRDVKPSNVMIDRQGNVKVMDFGLAKAASTDGSLTQSGVIMGTPNYLSPEQGRGDSIDGRSDLYSLGVMMYELLAGDLPFRADTPAGLIFKHVYEEPVPVSKRNPEIPPFLEEIVHKLLKKDPTERYQNGKELVADLHEFMDAQDHYMAGGKRRAKAPTSSARTRSPQARSAEVAAPREREGDATLADAAPRPGHDAPTETIEKKPIDPLENRSQQVTIIRERASMAPLWVTLFLAAAGGGGFYLWQNHYLEKWGLLASHRPVLTLSAEQLPAGVSARLKAVSGATRIDLHAEEKVTLDTGVYQLSAERKGYKKIDDTELLVEDEGGVAHLRAAPGGADFVVKLAPSDEMVQALKDATEAVKQAKEKGDGESFTAAAAALARVDDPAWKPEGGKSVKELQEELDAAKKTVQDKYVAGQALADAKSWRKLQEMAEPQKADPRWDAFLRMARRGIDQEAKDLLDAEAARDKGALDDAVKKVEAVLRDDPDCKEAQDLLPKLQDLRNKRELALSKAASAADDESLHRAEDLLQKYLDQVKSDETASAALRTVLEKLKAPREDLVGPLEAAINAGDWKSAAARLAALEKAEPGHPKLQTWRSQIDQGLAASDTSAAVRRAVDGLDEVVRKATASPDSLLAAFDPASPWKEKERDAFAKLAEARARIVDTKHVVGAVTLSDPTHAHVETSWTLTLEVEGEVQKVELAHAIDLVLVGKDWKFSRFVASERNR